MNILVLRSLLCVFIASSCADGTLDDSALMQTVASMQRISVPNRFFDDSVGLPGPAAPRASQYQVPSELARFDVGEDAVPMPRWHNTNEGFKTGPAAISLEQVATPPVHSPEAPQQSVEQFATQLAHESEAPQQAFQLADEADKLKVAADEAPMQLSAVFDTEPPLAAAQPATVPANELVEAAVPQIAKESPKGQSNRDFEDAQLFVECQANGGDCSHLAPKPSSGDKIQVARPPSLAEIAEAEVATRREQQLAQRVAEAKIEDQAFERRKIRQQQLKDEQAFERRKIRQQQLEHELEAAKTKQIEQLEHELEAAKTKQIEDNVAQLRQHARVLSQRPAADFDAVAQWRNSNSRNLGIDDRRQGRQPPARGLMDSLQRQDDPRDIPYHQVPLMERYDAGQSQSSLPATSPQWPEMPRELMEEIDDKVPWENPVPLHLVGHASSRRESGEASPRGEMPMVGRYEAAPRQSLLHANARMQYPSFTELPKTPPRELETGKDLSLEQITRRLYEDEQRILAAVEGSQGAASMPASPQMYAAEYPPRYSLPAAPAVENQWGN